MLRLSVWCLFCLLVLSAAGVWADPVRPTISGVTGPTTTLTPAQIEQLVEQLGDKQFAKRKMAKDTLEQLGPVALPFLQAALNKEKNPEIRRQLQSLIPSLEQMAALTPTLLSITFKDKPLTD